MESKSKYSFPILTFNKIENPQFLNCQTRAVVKSFDVVYLDSFKFNLYYG